MLRDPDLVRTGAGIARTVATLPHASPDMFHGPAGRLRVHLMFWQQTGDAEHLSHAIAAGECLLSRCEQPADGMARWTIPPGYEDLSGDAYLGYAHGAAGIGDALLDLFQATSDPRFLAASRAAGRWLMTKAVRLADNGVNWPTLDALTDRPAGAFWCHGAAGIGPFFLNLSAVDDLPDAVAMAERPARTVSMASPPSDRPNAMELPAISNSCWTCFRSRTTSDFCTRRGI